MEVTYVEIIKSYSTNDMLLLHLYQNISKCNWVIIVDVGKNVLLSHKTLGICTIFYIISPIKGHFRTIKNFINNLLIEGQFLQLIHFTNYFPNIFKYDAFGVTVYLKISDFFVFFFQFSISILLHN